MISLTDQIITTNINLSPRTLVEFPELFFFRRGFRVFVAMVVFVIIF